MNILLGKGLYGERHALKECADGERLVSVSYQILKTPVETGGKVDDSNRGPTVADLTMTLEYAERLARELTELVAKARKQPAANTEKSTAVCYWQALQEQPQENRLVEQMEV